MDRNQLHWGICVSPSCCYCCWRARPIRRRVQLLHEFLSLFYLIKLFFSWQRLFLLRLWVGNGNIWEKEALLFISWILLFLVLRQSTYFLKLFLQLLVKVLLVKVLKKWPFSIFYRRLLMGIISPSTSLSILRIPGFSSQWTKNTNWLISKKETRGLALDVLKWWAICDKLVTAGCWWWGGAGWCSSPGIWAVEWQPF